MLFLSDGDIEKILTMDEVIKTVEGAFREYMLRQQDAGADLGHLKPPHINPPDEIINSLTGVTAKPRVRRAREAKVAAS